MRLRMFALAVTRIIEHGRGRPGTTKGLVIANIDPAPPGVGFALGQDRHGRVVAMQPLRSQDMRFHPAQQRIERRADRAHLSLIHI